MSSVGTYRYTYIRIYTSVLLVYLSGPGTLRCAADICETSEIKKKRASLSLGDVTFVVNLRTVRPDAAVLLPPPH